MLRNTPVIDGDALLEKLRVFINRCVKNKETGSQNQKKIKKMTEELASIGYTYIPVVSNFTSAEFDFFFESVNPDITLTHENYSFLHALALNSLYPTLMDKVLHQDTINLKINPSFEVEPYSNTALHLLISNESYKNARFLINRANGKEINIDYAVQDNEGKTTLILAVKMHATEMFEFLLKNIPQDKLPNIVNIPDKGGNTALHYAMLLGDEKSVDLLITAGADVTIKNKKGFTAIDLLQLKHDSLIGSTLKSVSIDATRDEKAQFNVICHSGGIPINALTRWGSVDRIEILSQKSPDVERKLHSLDKEQIVHPKRFYENTGNIWMSGKEKNYFTEVYNSFTGKSLQTACLEGRVKLREAYQIQQKNKQQTDILKKQDINQKLRIAASKDLQEDIINLYKQGADINSTSSNGNTSLHWAAQNGYESCYNLLISLGADNALTNNDKKTAEELLMEKLSMSLKSMQFS